MLKPVRIGCAAGYWGDSPEAARQLVSQGEIDYLVFDYLAEVTMSILVRAREKNPDAGYAVDFISLVMQPLLAEIVARKITVIVNAGGVNVAACAAALRAVAIEAGVVLRIGTVEGDDVLPQLDGLRADGVTEMFTGRQLPDDVVSANAYLGAFPVAAALDAGADVVITGRCVDSAVALGPLIHEFGWQHNDYDQLACGTLAGHIIECGAQATGGNFTDWRDVVDGWHDMGYPIASCYADGSFEIGKPVCTGGVVSVLSVGEQILYEIGDPCAYVMPDVVCDFSNTRLRETGPDRVAVTGVTGRKPTASYKVSATYRDGYRATSLTVITGFEAIAKGQACADALLRRSRRLFVERELQDFHSTAVHFIGAESLWGDAGTATTRELIMQMEVRHPQREALEIYARETVGVALSMTTGRCMAGTSGRPGVSPVIAQYAFLIDKAHVAITVKLDNRNVDFQRVETTETTTIHNIHNAPASGDMSDTPIDTYEKVPLLQLAVARSGDKGDMANIGVMARSPEAYQWLQQYLTAELVAQRFAHFTQGAVSRYELPGFTALNFLLRESLGGGGTSSLHVDKQAKTYAQILLAMMIPVPPALARQTAQQSERTS